MKNRILPILFIVGTSLLLYLISRSFSQEEIIAIVEGAGIFAPIVYILLFLLTLVLAPLSGSPLVFAGFFAFGHAVIIYSVIAFYISYVVNFWIARKWGTKIVVRFVGKKDMSKIDNLVKSYGVATLILLRLFQNSISDFVSFAMGLTKMKFKNYFVISVLASIPSTAIWYFLSLNAETPAEFTIIMLVFTVSVSSIFILGGIILKRLRSNS